MNVTMIRKQLNEYIEEADEKKIKGLFMLVEDEIHDQNKFLLTKEQLALLNEERRKHKEGQTKSYSWGKPNELFREKVACRCIYL